MPEIFSGAGHCGELPISLSFLRTVTVAMATSSVRWCLEKGTEFGARGNLFHILAQSWDLGQNFSFLGQGFPVWEMNAALILRSEKNRSQRSSRHRMCSCYFDEITQMLACNFPAKGGRVFVCFALVTQTWASINVVFIEPPSVQC